MGIREERWRGSGKVRENFYGVESQTKSLGIGQVIKLSNMAGEENPLGRGKDVRMVIEDSVFSVSKQSCTGQS